MVQESIHWAVRRLTVKSREIECYNNPIAPEFDRHLGSAAVDVPVKFQSDWKSHGINTAFVASRLHEIL